MFVCLLDCNPKYHVKFVSIPEFTKSMLLVQLATYMSIELGAGVWNVSVSAGNLCHL